LKTKSTNIGHRSIRELRVSLRARVTTVLKRAFGLSLGAVTAACFALVACSGNRGASAPPQAAGQAAAASSETHCPPSWMSPPPTEPALAVPSDAGVLLHFAATGTQNYACVASADAGAKWSPVGPNATLADCSGASLGRHFASEGGSAYPEWQTRDGAYVVAQKVAGAPSPDGGAGAVPWLLLRAVDAGGAGPIARTEYVQRVATAGGMATGSCDAGAAVAVPYTADYYFYGR
jgi:hypothetical protein